ncbi:RNA polymerase sigma factor SigZ [Ferrimonas pelagia]|uniref:RNA polymerase sigma factor SigZ n=1 Tax=Ferrimonas pelagia TaxID=1177826 RepID=A0ABP9F5J1_9GAMM
MQTHWQQHKTQLRSYISKRVDDPAAVDDILQEVYIKAHTKLHQLKAQGSLTGWLYRIAYNVIMDHFRAHKPLDELPDDLAAVEADHGQNAHREMALCLRPLIEQLPESYRLPLQLAELEGLSQQRVADRLGLSLSGAKSRIQRGRAKLRERLTACCDVEIGAGGVIGFERKPGTERQCP